MKIAFPQCRRLVRVGLLTLLPLLIIVERAWADADDTFNVTGGVSVVHDDNLFRLPSGTDANAVLGKSTKADDITVSSVGFKLNKPYSLQRFELEVNAVDTRYRTFDYLNFTAVNYAAAWRWSVTPYLHGNLTSSRKQELNSFVDYTDYGVRNLRTDRRQRFDGVLEASGSWRILGGVEQITRTNSQAYTQVGDTRLNNVEGGLRYDFRSGSSLSYIARSGRGEYFNQDQPIPFPSLFDNRFDQRENEVRMVWAVTGKTTIDGRFAHLERTHAHFGQRDFSGNVGNLNVKWNITGKTSLTAEVARDLNSFQSLSSSYTSDQRFSLSPYWQISAKTALRARYDYVRRDYRGAIADTAANDRVDTLNGGLIALEWQALRTLLVSASLKNERRTSNQPGFDFESTMVGISAQAAF